VLAFEHEVDAEECGGEDVEEVGEPLGDRGEEIAGGGVDGSGAALGEGVDAEPVGEGDSFDFGDDVGEALGEFGREVAEIAQNGRKASGEEECDDEGDAEDEENDGDGARGVIAANVELRDPVDRRHENNGEEGADVEDQELFFEGPGEGEEEEDRDRKEDVAADGGAGS
jgi:hypothetical protein